MAAAMGNPTTRPPLRPQPRNSCGNFPNFMTGDRIVGGEAAALPIPWQVSVRDCQSGTCHFCGGTILDETTVMSAAHCFTTGQSMSGFYITAGVVNRNDNNGQTIEIANGVWNADMPYQGNNNDFVILKLKSALTFNGKVGAACLPEANHAPDAIGQTCFVSGWGTLESDANGLPTDLQWVAVPTVTNAQCSNSYNEITTSMICAGLPEGGKDSCQGDSGGPFICRENGKAVLTGVVSFGIGCALPDYPGVYARVTAVLDWVKANMGGNTPPPPPPPVGPPAPPTTAGPTTVGPTSPPTTAGPTEGPVECPDEWIGDNYCDDECNNDDNDFDGGDCCQDEAAEGWNQYCNDCLCLEMPETTEGPAECPDEWIGDNYCDDVCNNDDNDFDGGDCCQDEAAEGWNHYCNDCLCLEMPETTEGPIECPDEWIGDNYCDDQCNNDDNDFDGGDCCQEEPNDDWTAYCNTCECLE